MKNKDFNWKKIYVWLVKMRDAAGPTLSGLEKLPSIRQIMIKFKYSKTTVLRALEQLERDGLVYSKERTGYYFTLTNNETGILNNVTVSTTRSDQITDLLYYSPKNGIYNYSNAVLDKSLVPHDYIRKCLRATITGSSTFEEEFISAPGLPSLRNRLTSVMSARGIDCTADDILITSGDTQSLGSIIKSVIHQKQKILLAVPCYYGIIQFIKSSNLPVVTIPLSPSADGVDVQSLETILKTENIGLLYINSTVHNPTGQTLSARIRDSIYLLTKRYEIPILEDDIFYDLIDGTHKPKPFKSIDADNRVIYFSSFSKTLSPGFRVGWCLPGKFIKKILNTELLNNNAASSIAQKVLDEYLRRGYYIPHITNRQSTFKNNNKFISTVISKQPVNIISYNPPIAGFIHWLRLGKEFRMNDYRNYCIKNKIFVPSGNIFYLDKDHENHIRLCTGLKLTKKDITNLTFLIDGIKDHYPKADN